MIELHHSPRTRSVRVLWLLEELGLPYQLHTMSFSESELKSEAFLRLNPLGRVPVLVDGPVTMSESGAIVEYLLERYGEGRLSPSVGDPRRGSFLQWVHFSEATFMPPITQWAQHTLFKPEEERIPAVVVDARARLDGLVAYVDGSLAERPYLLGDSFSAADVMMGYAGLIAKWFGAVGEAAPNLAAYLDRLESRPALQRALSA